MIVSNIFLAWQNRADEATLSGGSWQSTLPITNMQNRQVQKVARTANALAASTLFDIDLGAPRTIAVLALVVHNISAAGACRIRGSNVSNFASTVYDSGAVNVWPAGQIPQNLLEWEEDNFWLGTMSAQARAGYQSPYINIMATPAYARYWRVEIADTTNSDGYVQIGRLFLANGWTPTVNYNYGAELGYEDPTPVDTSLSGAEFFDQRSKFRVFSFDLQYITGTEAYGYAIELQRLAGITGEVLAVPDAADTGNIPARAFVGRLRQIGRVRQTQPTAYEVSLKIKELL